MTKSPVHKPCSFAIALVILAAGSARAAERCYDELGHEIPGACDGERTPAHDGWHAGDPPHRGFFLRMTLGGGPAGYTTSRDLHIGKAAGNFDLAIGGAPLDNLAIYGFTRGNTISQPTLEANGVAVQTTNDVSFSASILGAGVTYYLPWNIYLDAGIGIAVLSLAYSDANGETTQIESDPGVGLTLGVGKEWMVSDSWGLGAVFKLLSTRVKDVEAGITEELEGTSATLAFSATFF